MEGYYENIIDVCKRNNMYRKILYIDGQESEIVTMCIKNNEKVSLEVHDSTQYIFGVSGFGLVKISNNSYPLKENMLVVVPKGKKHEITNVGEEKLKIYTIYTDIEHTTHKKRM